MQRPDPTPPADDAARAEALALLNLRHAALAYIASDGAPGISRIALGRSAAGVPVTLISSLAPHFAALGADGKCALLLGEPGLKGDPLTHPRLMIRARAEFVTRESAFHGTLRTEWLRDHPKSKLYIDFTDFAFVLLHPVSALLNGGFGKAFRLTPQDF
jgi:putative heme iron utilization protein